VTGPIIATAAVLMAVFVPVAFIPRVAGRLYNQFALTVATLSAYRPGPRRRVPAAGAALWFRPV
jgi:AcrB/AcrD/AcrF family protein